MSQAGALRVSVPEQLLGKPFLLLLALTASGLTYLFVGALVYVALFIAVADTPPTVFWSLLGLNILLHHVITFVAASYYARGLWLNVPGVLATVAAGMALAFLPLLFGLSFAAACDGYEGCTSDSQAQDFVRWLWHLLAAVTP